MIGGEPVEAVMVRYGEVFLKSERVKRRFVSAMAENIGLALEAEGLAHRIETHRGRILIYGDDPTRIAETAARVFGVVSASVCTVTTADIEGITAAALKRAERRLRPGMSFAVRARRSGVPGFSSQELAAAVGSAILERFDGVRVDLTRPDYRSLSRQESSAVSSTTRRSPGRVDSLTGHRGWSSPSSRRG